MMVTLLTGPDRVVRPPAPDDGHEQDAEAELEAVCEDVDEGGAAQHDVAPPALGVVVLPDGRLLHLLLLALPGGGGGDGGRGLLQLPEVRLLVLAHAVAAGLLLVAGALQQLALARPRTRCSNPARY